jgi:hypothetical protein
VQSLDYRNGGFFIIGNYKSLALRKRIPERSGKSPHAESGIEQDEDQKA